MRATVLAVVFTGPLTRLTVDVGGDALEALGVGSVKISAGDECIIEIPPDRPLVFHSYTERW